MKDSTTGLVVGAAGLALSLGVYFWSVSKASAQPPLQGLGYGPHFGRRFYRPYYSSWNRR